MAAWRSCGIQGSQAPRGSSPRGPDSFGGSSRWGKQGVTSPRAPASTRTEAHRRHKRPLSALVAPLPRVSGGLSRPPRYRHRQPGHVALHVGLKTGTPRREKLSAITSNDTVLPVPVAPATIPWRFPYLGSKYRGLLTLAHEDVHDPPPGSSVDSCCAGLVRTSIIGSPTHRRAAGHRRGVVSVEVGSDAVARASVRPPGPPSQRTISRSSR
jgi:hypothetical protein